jgi:Alginate lyase
MAQSVLYNSVAYALSASSSFSQMAASIIDTWFLNSATSMNPQMKYGQVVRGPGTQTGSFMGILDARGFVQVFNGIAILKLAHSPDWTSGRETALQHWVSLYDNWLVNSDLGRKSASSPKCVGFIFRGAKFDGMRLTSNHGTFWMNQMVVLKIYENDLSGARAAVKSYFTHQFLDQIVASGEQPFEAVRTRPFHYRCFNLQAMIVSCWFTLHSIVTVRLQSHFLVSRR